MDIITSFEEEMLVAACTTLVADGYKGKRLMAALFERNSNFEDPLSKEFIYGLCDQYQDLVEQAIDSDDVKELFKVAPVLACMSGIEYGIAIEQMKEKFGKRLNLNQLRHAVKDEQRRIRLQEDGEKRDVADIAREWASLHLETWAYDVQYDAWRTWTGSYWQEQPKKHLLDKEAIAALQDADTTISTQSGLNLFERLAEADCIREFKSVPGLINFANGTLDTTTSQLRSFSKDDNLTYCLPYSYNPCGFHPDIDRFLTEALPDEYARLAYMTHGGLALLRDTLIHQFCGFIGATRAGKSTLLALLNALCGAQDPYAFAGPSIFNRELEGKRARFKWADCLLVAVDELPQEALRDEETLKIMTAHGGVEMRGIGKDEQKNNRWRPKLIFTTNDQPSYKDNSGAVKERAVFSEIAQAKPKQERDPKLFEKLLPELGSFASSCIELALQALEKGWYPQSARMKALLDRIANESNPLKHFLYEECRLGPDFKIPTSTLYEHYKTFCDDNGHKGVLAKTNFAKELRMMNIGVEPKHIRFGNLLQRGLTGIRLRNEHDPEDDGNFYQDDEPLQKPDRMLTVNVNGGNFTVNSFTQPVEPDVTVLTVNQSNTTCVKRDIPCESQGISNTIKRVTSEKTLTPLTADVNEPVERDEHVNGHQNGSLTAVNIPASNGHKASPQAVLFHKGQTVKYKGKSVTLVSVTDDSIVYEEGSERRLKRIEKAQFSEIKA